MSKENIPYTQSASESSKGNNPDSPNKKTSAAHNPNNYFRENLQKQKEETKRKIKEKMEDCLKNRQNKPTFFKDKKS